MEIQTFSSRTRKFSVNLPELNHAQHGEIHVHISYLFIHMHLSRLIMFSVRFRYKRKGRCEVNTCVISIPYIHRPSTVKGIVLFSCMYLTQGTFGEIFKGLVLQKPVNANLGLKVNPALWFSCFKRFHCQF